MPRIQSGVEFANHSYDLRVVSPEVVDAYFVERIFAAHSDGGRIYRPRVHRGRVFTTVWIGFIRRIHGQCRRGNGLRRGLLKIR